MPTDMGMSGDYVLEIMSVDVYCALHDCIVCAP